MNTYDNKPLPKISGSHGFTIIELLVAMAISSIVLAAVTTLYSGLTRSYTTEAARGSAQQDLRAGLGLMVEDIRMAGLDPMGTAGGIFTQNSLTDIEFIADLNFNGAVDDDERIRYYLNGTELRQQHFDAATGVMEEDVLLDNVSALNFDYTQPPILEILMTVQEPAGRDVMVTRTLTERVRLRNQ